MKLIFLALFVVTLSGCITTYRDFPEASVGVKPQSGTCETLQFNVKRFDILDAGGYNELREVFKKSAICTKMVPVEEKADKGLYLEVNTKWKPITLPALVFGYLSVSTLTILPAWSTQDGYIVDYDLYVDGVKKDAFKYDITRKMGLWLPLLPLAWINAFTYSESEAFAATARQFSIDAQTYFGTKAATASR
jgi:hypothetical protein